MTLTKLILMIGVIAAILTAVVGLVFKNHKNWLLTFLQNFTGALFIFSGWVKAIDPLGTAYKMEQYFAEFETTFEATWFSFLAPLFPFLSKFAVFFSVTMIVLEIILGLMLLLGARTKFTSWAFLLLVGFFTFLTGFTYLTGYVPDGVNFFQFGQWGEYVETNMKVTDCGCFGDFLKLEPRVSFFKDLALLVPAFIFVFKHKDMHQLFTEKVRWITVAVATAGVTLFCLSNYVWDIPGTDFRPFKKEVNVAERLRAEEEAANNVQILAYKMTNKSSGKVVELPYDQYLKEFKDYPKEEWDLEQIKTEPVIPRTKISDFEVSDAEGNNVTESILSEPGYSFMLIAHKMYAEDADYQKRYAMTVNPVMDAAQAAGWKVFAITAYNDAAVIEKFRHDVQAAYPFYQADDILLKTIVRSNPGIVLLKNGTIVNKWHYKKLPTFEEIKAEN